MTANDGNLRTVTADTQETISASPAEPPAFAMLRDTLDRWRRGEKPGTDAWECWRAMALADRAYEMAERIE